MPRDFPLTPAQSPHVPSSTVNWTVVGSCSRKSHVTNVRVTSRSGVLDGVCVVQGAC